MPHIRHNCPRCGKFIASPDVHEITEYGDIEYAFYWCGKWEEFNITGLGKYAKMLSEYIECCECELHFVEIEDKVFVYSMSKHKWIETDGKMRVLLT